MELINKSLIDVHCHLAAFRSESNGCFMSSSFEKGTLVKLVKWKLGLEGKTPDEINASYVRRLVGDLTASKYVGRAVILALDGVYDESGRLDENKTHMMIGNDYVKSVAALHPDLLLFGASVNPQRRDAVDELNRVIAQGAKLIKVLPPSQVFDPMDPKYTPYFRILAQTKVPLLCHIGHEFSVTAGKQEYGFPDRLKRALDEGVIVIGAHACSSAVFFQGKFYSMLQDLFKRYPNFHIDLSAVTLPNRASITWKLKNLLEYRDRFVFGTDYPLSAYATPFQGRFSPLNQWKLWREKSIFDKQAMILHGMNLSVNPKPTERLLRLSS